MSADSQDRPNNSNSNDGDNRNSMENIEAKGNVNQRNEIHQHTSVSDGGTIIQDPNSQNWWIGICQSLSSLLKFESHAIPALTLTGLLGLGGGIGWLLIPLYVAGTVPSIQRTPIFLALIGALILAVPIVYMSTDSESRCPECNERFALRTVQVRKTDETVLDSNNRRIHGERDVECIECGYKNTVVDSWTPEEFAAL